MKPIITIMQGDRTRIATPADFPLTVGSSSHAGIIIEGLHAGDVAATIAMRGDRFHVYPGDSHISIRLNHNELTDEAQLHDGDALSILASTVTFRQKPGQVTIEIVQHAHTRMQAHDGTAPDPAPEHLIEPIPFSPSRNPGRSGLGSHAKRLAGAGAALLLLLFAFLGWFVFTSRQVLIQTEPAPDRIQIQGGLIAPHIGSSYLLRPGQYILRASRKGYHDLEKTFSVSRAKGQKISLVMQKLPGRLTLVAHQKDNPSKSVNGARVFIDGIAAGVTPFEKADMAPGERQLTVTADGYQRLTIQLTVKGMGIAQSLDLELVPGWSRVSLSSEPAGALVRIDGKQQGQTPLVLELDAGVHDLTLSAPGYKDWQSRMEIEAHHPQTLGPIMLVPADAVLVLHTNPESAQLSIDGTYRGQTPVTLELAPDTDHRLVISKAGYKKAERTIRIASQDTLRLNLVLEARSGVIQFLVTPPDATLVVDGRKYDSLPRSVELLAVDHTIELKKDGFVPYRTRITPRPGYPQQLRVALKKKTVAGPASQSIIKASNGYTLKLIEPATYTMGSSRREQGRRSNETVRHIELSRPFYMGTREVTNREFREFRSSHTSGSFQGNSLNRDAQPVSQVSWDEAALFCNWLSAKEKLPPVYVIKAGRPVSREPIPIGYRLPTEAEWEYCARYVTRGSFRKYPWGTTFPPPSRSANIADAAARDLLGAHVEKYTDGFAVAAPTASFTPNELGLYDLGGNVSEWCHDYYSIYSYDSGAVYRDPSGPGDGKHHVLRGSSWKHASISTLRAAYRDYSSDKRQDVGFRICRYER